jgi:4-amino-4-deoxy-L-arabinose transferase-like glycosyltransferase
VDGADRFNPLTSPAVAVGLLVGLTMPLFFLKLGGAGLVDPDEPYYAVPALEMLKSGSWLVPVFRGQPWFDKPIFFYWIVLGAFKAFGVTEWAARLGSALAGFGGAVAVATLSPFGWRKNGAHVLASIVLATSLEYAFLARSAVTDMTLTLFLTLRFLAIARHLESGRLIFAACGGAAFGLGVLTKGPVGIVVPAVAVAAYGLATRRRELLAPKALAVATAGFAATALPWYAYMFAAHRELVVDVFLGQENLGRFVNAEHAQFPLFYVAVLAAGLMPWSAALPAALLRAFNAARRGDERSGASPGPVYALCWFAAVLGVFSLSASKLLTYILPAFPAAAFLIADYWRDALAPRGTRTRVSTGAQIVAWTGAAIAVGVVVAALASAGGGRYDATLPPMYGLALVLVAGAIAAVVAVRFGSLAVFAGVQAASTVAIVLFVVCVALPRLDGSLSTKSLVARLATSGLSGQVVGAYRVRDVSLDFYLGRTLARENDTSELVERVRSDPGKLWVARPRDVDELAARSPLAVERVLTVSRCAVVRLSPERL